HHGIDFSSVLDSLVVSRLLKYDIPGGHSIAAWGERFGIEKAGKDIDDWTELTEEMVERCHSDTLINLKIIEKYWKYLVADEWQDALAVEHYTAYACGQMSSNGFPFDKQ